MKKKLIAYCAVVTVSLAGCSTEQYSTMSNNIMEGGNITQNSTVAVEVIATETAIATNTNATMPQSIVDYFNSNESVMLTLPTENDSRYYVDEVYDIALILDITDTENPAIMYVRDDTFAKLENDIKSNDATYNIAHSLNGYVISVVLDENIVVDMQVKYDTNYNDEVGLMINRVYKSNEDFLEYKNNPMEIVDENTIQDIDISSVNTGLPDVISSYIKANPNDFVFDNIEQSWRIKFTPKDTIMSLTSYDDVGNEIVVPDEFLAQTSIVESSAIIGTIYDVTAGKNDLIFMHENHAIEQANNTGFNYGVTVTAEFDTAGNVISMLYNPE